MSKEMTIWVVIGIYAVFMLAIGILNSKKGGGMTDFTVGGRNAGAWISALSYGTAYFSAVMFSGYSGGSGWSFGLYSTLVGVGNAVIGSYLAWKVLAGRTRETTRRLKIKSMPQLCLLYTSIGQHAHDHAVLGSSDAVARINFLCFLKVFFQLLHSRNRQFLKIR